MIVVSGCPRSGTSLMMDCHRIALGDDRVLCRRQPWEERKLTPGDSRWANILQYTLKKQQERQSKQAKAQTRKRQDKARRMNPKGFWECEFTMQGVTWRKGVDKLAGKVCKIVSQGLRKSNPAYIDKVVYMLRDPREVAVSQADLNRSAGVDLDEAGKVISPAMYVQVTRAAARWLEMTGTPYIVVVYSDLLQHPDRELARVQEFIGEGNFVSNHPVEAGLYRSKSEDAPETPLMTVALEMFEAFKAGNLGAVVEASDNGTKAAQKEAGNFFCFRLGRPTAYQECEHCYKDPGTAANFRLTAQAKGVDWENEPCTFEIGGAIPEDMPEGYKTVSESIAANHWRDLLSNQEAREEINKRQRERRDRQKKNCKGCGGREPCRECVEKHLGAAAVLCQEIGNGYDHKVLAIGHLSEAADEIRAMDASLAKLIRDARKLVHQDRAQDIRWDVLFNRTDALPDTPPEVQ
jgi:hypothetical protein